MHEIARPVTFEEFRATHHDTLRRQREHLQDDSVAAKILREGTDRLMRWVPWDGAYAVQR